VRRRFGVPPAAIDVFLDALDERYGGAAGYLRSIGVSDATLGDVAEALCEPVARMTG
jgi:hypothetical protein